MKKITRFKWPILFAVIGLALNLVAVVSVVEILRDTGTAFLGPGETSIEITKAGDYTLWHETKTVIDGQFMSFPDDIPSGTTIKITKQPESTAVPLRKDSSTTMESGGTRRISVGQLTLTTPGQYQVAVTGSTEKCAFYLEETKLFRVLLKIMGSGLVGMACLFAGVGSFIYVLARPTNRVN